MRPHIETWGDPSSRVVLVHLHEDEAAALEAMRAVSGEFRCRCLRLRQRGTREVSIKGCEVDPNRMFSSSDPGVRGFADEVLSLLDADLIIAVHNNKGESYTARSYLEGLAADAAAVHLEPGAPETDFFLVTQGSDFEALVQQRQNVILQSPDAADDGSLSVWAARKGVRYMNVEALRGRVEEQRGMLRLLMDRCGVPVRSLL